jgi:hypothetical protein
LCLNPYNDAHSRSYLSNDYGASFSLAYDEANQIFSSTTVSEINSDGSLMVITTDTGIVKSVNNGGSWSFVYASSYNPKKGISMVSNGSLIAMNGSDTFTSTNSASSFSTLAPSPYTFRQIAVFNDGSNRLYTLTYSVDNTYPIFQSGSSFGTPFTAVTGPGNKQWWAISASDNGQYILAGTCNYYSNNTNELWRSNNGGASWIKI